MSKLSQMKQKAYQAGKSRNWDQAIDCYEQILELEKNNPTVVNELGDLCLKSGQTARAIKHFLTAASRYRKTGLLNNSVAIYKKILRHDDANLNAHWYLAEIRAGQGLVVEGQDHASRFLAESADMPGEQTEIFQKRYVKLFELYPESAVILDKLVGIFRTRDMGLEAARARILLACCARQDGDEDGAESVVAEVLGQHPEVKNYPEYGRWSLCLDPDASPASQQADFNTVSFDDVSPDSPAGEEAAPAAVPTVEIPVTEDVPVVEIPPLDEAPEVEVAVDEPAAARGAAADPEDDDCLSIDVEGASDFSELIAAATGDVDADEGEAEEVFDDNPVGAAPAVEVPAPDEEKVDLLAQILSEEGGGLGDESQQLDTISAQIGSVVGGNEGEDDAGRLYEMGMVYLEMGMFDQACESFSVAACDEEFALRAHEMWGMTLQKADDPDGSVRVLTDGLDFADDGSREHLTLRYHIARAHEMANRNEAAQAIYQDIHRMTPDFMDVDRRLEKVTG